MIDTLFGGSALWFTAPALLGTGFLLIQLILGEIGGDLDADVDGGSDAKWLSLQTVAAFLVGFGWLGLTAYRALDLGFNASVLVGALAGLGVARLMVWTTGRLLRLQSDANVRLEDAVGLEGSVAVLIPPRDGGTGRVTLVIHESQHEFPAGQEGEHPIPTHARVRVMRADEAGGMLTVEAC